MTPQNMKYTESHEWVALDEGSGIATVGITDFAVSSLGDIVYVELPEPDQAVKQLQPLGAIESVKAAVDINSPVSGTVTEVNDAVTEDFDIFKEGAYDKAWMVKIKVSDPSELANLMTAAAYQKHTDECQE